MKCVIFPTPHYLEGLSGARAPDVPPEMRFVLVITQLPFLLSRLRLCPATASEPPVTTIPGATGMPIYFFLATTSLGL